MTDERSAASTLDAIRAGGMQSLANVRLRIAEALNALERGAFTEAQGHVSEVLGALAPLADAETHIAIADGSYLLRARDLRVGMTLAEVGEITQIDNGDCVAHGEHVQVYVGEQQLPLGADMLLYVAKDGHA